MKVFEYDSGFMKSAVLLSRLTLLNLVWLVCCIPIITAGAATAAQYYSATQLSHGNTLVLQNFKTGFKMYWKRATVMWIAFTFLTAIFCMGYYILNTAQVPGKTVLFAISGLAFLTMTLVMLWIFPVMITFTGTMREILFNAFVFTFMYVPVTLIAAAFYGIAVFLFIRFTAARGLFILFGHSLIVYAVMAVFNKVFQKYLQE